MGVPRRDRRFRRAARAPGPPQRPGSSVHFSHHPYEHCRERPILHAVHLLLTTRFGVPWYGT
jgi:hypothetical protein